MAWVSPAISVIYGSYFKPDPDEEKKIVELTQAALAGAGGAIVPRHDAVRKIATIFGIDNVDAALVKIEEETAARQQQALEMQSAETAILHESLNERDGEGASRGKPAKAPGGRSGVPAADDKAEE